MSKKKKKWFKTIDQFPGYAAITWQGRILSFLDVSLVFFAVIYNFYIYSPYDNNDKYLWQILLIWTIALSGLHLIIRVKGEPNRWLKGERKKKAS